MDQCHTRHGPGTLGRYIGAPQPMHQLKKYTTPGAIVQNTQNWMWGWHFYGMPLKFQIRGPQY